jgi:AhpD family alkylhydroperoxidase
VIMHTIERKEDAMKYSRFLVLALVALFALGTGLPAHAQSSPRAKAALNEIQQTFGLVPTFYKMFPEEGVADAWETMKNLQLSPTTAIPPKYKELIGLGVAAQIPCEYCVYFHTGAAKLNGATDREIREAIAEASLERFWSTILNGTGQDMTAFRAEVQRMADRTRAAGDTPPSMTPATDAASAYKDMEATFGFVPTFAKAIPTASVATAWNEWKNIDMNPNTALPGKYKSLISLAVSSQVPCAYCVYADKEFARAQGVTEQEMDEAIGLAAETRHWSTFLNGSGLDKDTFRREADAMFAHVRSSTTAAK